MIAVIRDGGKQYRAEEGKILLLDRRNASPGDPIELTEVLCLEDGGKVKIGRPLVEGAKVLAEVVGETKGPKLIFHRFRRRKGSRTRSGHRQKYTEVRISKIES